MIREKLVRRVVAPTRIATYQDPVGNALYGYPGVFRDPESGAWRMVYQTVRVKGKFRLAESIDGLNWRPRATTGEIDLSERHAPNQILADDVGNLGGVYWDRTVPAEARVKLLATRCGKAEGPHRSSLWTSADGLRWTTAAEVRWQVRPSDPPSFPFYCSVRGSHVITSRPGFTDRRLWPHLILGRTDCQLAYSLNGWHWQRSLRDPFLPTRCPGAPDRRGGAHRAP